MEKEVGELKEDVTELKFKVRDLDFHYKALDREVSEIKSSIERFDTKLDKTVEKMIQIAEDAGARSPKWVMRVMYGVVATGFLGVLGWVVNAIIFGH